MNERSPEGSGGLQRRYGSEELETFKHVVRGIVGNLHARRSPLVAPDQIEVTLIRVAAAIFDLADDGVRDPNCLQKLAQARLDEAGEGPAMPGSHPAPPTRH